MNCYSKAFEIYSKLNYAQGIANALIGMRMVYKCKNQVDQAFEIYERARQITITHNLHRTKGILFGNIGTLHWPIKEPDKAIEYLSQAIEFFRMFGHSRGEGIFLGNIGLAYSNQQQYDKAMEYYQQALIIN